MSISNEKKAFSNYNNMSLTKNAMTINLCICQLFNKREYNLNDFGNYFKMSKIDEISHVTKFIFFVRKSINFIKNET